MRDEESIFAEALERKSPEQRAAFLAEACGEQTQLREQVESLLAAYEGGGGILESGLPSLTAIIPPDPADTPQIGAHIGPYKLLQVIGEGGMGVVYMAEQTAPLRRTVAIKIIKPGLDSKQVIARFEAERQALAMMDHPSIARVFDGGSTETGRPYFVMELVRGIPVTEYCDQHQLTPHQRLGLFLPVCQAVQHAHQKGIIHRDLKPSNVLITLQDGDKPTPKVIDFGIAKATAGQRLTDMTLFTEFRQLMGTPVYMSPEQAEMSAVMDVDTRSDVYALGVLLYELLTGTTPFDNARLAQAAYDEVRRIIREEEPPRPSIRLSTMGERLTTVSAARQTDGKKLSQTIRGELDWIVMKALEKERARRYETANALARDVERYLSDQPVEACPPSRAYRIKKLVRRNRTAVFAGCAIIAALLIGFILASMGMIEAHNQEKLTRRQMGKVQRNLALIFNAEGKGDSKDAQVMARQALETDRQLLGDDDIEVCLSLHVLAFTLVKSDPEQAIALERSAIAKLRRIPGIYQHVDLAYSLDNLGNLLSHKGQDAEAEAAYREALPLWRKAVGNDHLYVANTLEPLATFAAKAGRNQEAEAYLRECLEIRRRVQGNSHRATFKTLNMLVDLLEQQGRREEAESIRQQFAATHPVAPSTAP